ncbi:MDMPI N domain containing protein [Streptomyces sp. SDr-06]|uniref:zf-HC2 domain-containing protein n=1 Tax=Streptomyces sp. SDr-06 TaxID=2267702 RepID=UPI000DEB20E8|nr:zf-HC2 domain-containing protein [Streptomyces sp. SDr-06]RCH64619.1 MDMPI N domain containing protein [Streptomyces sp. SDr-06]
MEQGEPTPDDENTPRIPSPRAAGDDLTGGERGSGAFVPGPREGNRFLPASPEPPRATEPEPGPEPAPRGSTDPGAEPEAAADGEPSTAEAGPTGPEAAPQEATAHEPVPREAAPPSHTVLKSLLGAWALAACSAEETDAVEAHLTECAPCADEALRLRDAVGLLQAERSLDLDPMLRARVLENCLGRRPARIPVPAWAAPYDAEAARLDALLNDFGDAEWHAPVRLKWFERERRATRRTTVAGVIGHLMAVDALVATALGLDEPVPLDAEAAAGGPTARTEALWQAGQYPLTRTVRDPWREQSHTLIRTVSFAGRGAAELDVCYGEFALPLQDAMLDRAFECWIHAGDIAEAVDYPYDPPSGTHLHGMIDLAARILPAVLADRRRAGLAAPPRGLVTAGSPGRSLRLEIEGVGGGDWHIALDSPAAVASPEHEVAHVALDGVEFCKLAAGHVPPQDAAAGQLGDREAIRDVLFAAASLSRL